MDSYHHILSAANRKFSKLVKKPDKFLEPTETLFEDIKLLSKESWVRR